MSLRIQTVTVSILIALVLAASRTAAAPPTWVIRCNVDLGRDSGQRYGSVFDLVDEAGHTVAGAGFPDLYNTRFRTDRHSLQFFVRQPPETSPTALERLPRPDNDCGHYMFDLDGRLYSFNDTTGRAYRRWAPEREQWEDAPEAFLPAQPVAGDAVTRVANGLLILAENKITYEGKTLIPAPSQGRYHHLYYALGRLVFYHNHRAAEGGFTHLYSVPWLPNQAAPARLESADLLKLEVVGETPFAMGQLGGQVVTVSNYGGVYCWRAGGWRVVRRPSPGVSYQVYSMLNCRGELLLGQYPLGEVVAFDGETLKPRSGWPPRLATVSSSARECQSLAPYGGDIFAGVWPWAELWRGDGESWRFHGRPFSHPVASANTVHPYETESERLGLVINHWGQRITSMIPSGDSLYLATSSKGNSAWDPKTAFLTDRQRKEYGAFLRVREPGTLTAPLTIREGRTRLEFRADSNGLEIRQNGRSLGRSDLPLTLPGRLSAYRLRLGDGLYGPAAGPVTAR